MAGTPGTEWTGPSCQGVESFCRWGSPDAYGALAPAAPTGDAAPRSPLPAQRSVLEAVGHPWWLEFAKQIRVRQAELLNSYLRCPCPAHCPHLPGPSHQPVFGERLTH